MSSSEVDKLAQQLTALVITNMSLPMVKIDSSEVKNIAHELVKFLITRLSASPLTVSHSVPLLEGKDSSRIVDLDKGLVKSDLDKLAFSSGQATPLPLFLPLPSPEIIQIVSDHLIDNAIKEMMAVVFIRDSRIKYYIKAIYAKDRMYDSIENAQNAIAFLKANWENLIKLIKSRPEYTLCSEKFSEEKEEDLSPKEECGWYFDKLAENVVLTLYQKDLLAKYVVTAKRIKGKIYRENDGESFNFDKDVTIYYWDEFYSFLTGDMFGYSSMAPNMYFSLC